MSCVTRRRQEQRVISRMRPELVVQESKGMGNATADHLNVRLTHRLAGPGAYDALPARVAVRRGTDAVHVSRFDVVRASFEVSDIVLSDCVNGARSRRAMTRYSWSQRA